MKLTSSAQLDYTTALHAAERIVRICQDSGFYPPEALDIHHLKIAEVANLMNEIATALCLIGGKL